MSFVTIKAAMKTALEAAVSSNQFGIIQVTREDNSVTTYESFDKLLEAYKKVCTLADEELADRKSVYRPVAIRKGGFTQ